MKGFDMHTHTKQDLIEAKIELNDLLELYLDSDLAGDNQDRRNKIKATKLLTNIIQQVTS